MNKKLNVRPGFLALCFLLAVLYSSNGMQFVAWFSVVFISVLWHEMGHAFTARLFGKKAWIELSFFGGVTYFSQEGLRRYQSFLIALNGPLFGFALYVVSWLGLQIVLPESLLGYALKISTVVNLFWTLINLFPILPMDGGQLMRITFEGVFKSRGLSLAAFVSLVLSLGLALAAFLVQQYFFGSILFLFAFQNFELFKQARFLTLADRDVGAKKMLAEAIYAYETDDLEKALSIVEVLRKKTLSGMIFNQATVIHASILKDKKAYHALYEMLKPYPKLYEGELAPLMHEAAFFENQMALVHQLSSEAFIRENSKEVAFRAAVAAAHFHDETASLGWLKTACDLGLTPEEVKAHPLLAKYSAQLFEAP